MKWMLIMYIECAIEVRGSRRGYKLGGIQSKSLCDTGVQSTPCTSAWKGLQVRRDTGRGSDEFGVLL